MSNSNPYGNYVTTNYSDRDPTILFDDRQIYLAQQLSDDKIFSEQYNNQLNKVTYEDLIRKQTDIKTKPDDLALSVEIALNQRKDIYNNDNPTYFDPNNELKYFKKPHQRPPQDTLIIMLRLLNKILENPKNILIETTKSDDAIYCSGIFILLSGTSLYLLSNIFS